MFNLIFVDDEFIIRNGISKCIPWDNNGFHLSGLFENGQEALNFIENNPVDIVITDINMPIMNGLTLSKILADKFPRIMVLLLSGYDDFEYAQKAVKNHVRDFLLKPITADELSNVLTVINEELKFSRDLELQQEEMKEKLNISLPLLRERFFNRLINGKIAKENFNKRVKYFNWKNLECLYQISVIRIPESWDELEKITLQEYIKKITLITDEVFFSNVEDIVILFQDKDLSHLETRVKSMIESVFQYTGNQEMEQISAGCGEVEEKSSSISNSYTGAINALDYIKVLGISQILFIKDVRKSEKILPEAFHLMLEDVINKLKESNKEKTIETMDNLFSYIEKHYITPNEALSYYARIHHALYKFSQDMSLDIDNNFSSISTITTYKTITYAKESFLKLILLIEKQIELRRNDIIHSRIDRAKQIIENRYDEINFSLQDICNELYLSTSQFSFLFKEGTGQTFVEYLTSYRVEIAKKLLKSTDKKVYEIAESVGYQDPRYFSIIFKKYTGITALEYRKRLESE